MQRDIDSARRYLQAGGFRGLLWKLRNDTAQSELQQGNTSWINYTKRKIIYFSKKNVQSWK